MTDRPTAPGTGDGWAVIELAARAAHTRLGGGLLSAYAIGSLAHGGFRAAVSDIDLAVLTDDELGPHLTKSIRAIASDVEQAHALGERLSIFYASWSEFCNPPSHARFPAIDRYDLVRYGVLVHGTDLRAVYARLPSAAAIRQQAVDFALSRVTPTVLAKDLRQLMARGVTVHDATKLVLWPVRLQHVCDTGQATGNADAVEHYLRLADAGHRSLVGDALTWRDLPVMTAPGDAAKRIANEIHDLHAEVFRRLSEHPDVPRRRDLGERGRQLIAGLAQGRP